MERLMEMEEEEQEQEQEKEEKELRIVMLPWLSPSHIMAYVELAKRLRSRGLRISVVTTPLSIAWIEEELLQQKETFDGIDLVELPLPSVEGLPASVESIIDLNKGGTSSPLMEAVDRCEKPFEKLLQRLTPDFVIYSFMHYWVPRVAAKFRIPTIFFSVLGAAGVSFTGGMVANLPKNAKVEDMLAPPPAFPPSALRNRLFEMRNNWGRVAVNNGDSLSIIERVKMCEDESWAIAANTCRELEGVYIDYWLRSVRRPVFPLGILMPPIPPPPPQDRCLAWLNGRAVRSVVAVSFGNEGFLTKEESTALLLGLEQTGFPFLCILFGHDKGAALPPGFEHGTQGRGIVVTEWAPQLQILSHPSTRAFLTHCGWVSVMEALRFRLPLVALPFRNEQGLNARLLVEELKVGVEVRRNEEDGYFTKDDICDAVRAVMVGEERKELRSNVVRISKVLTSNNCEILETNINNFVSLIRMKASIKHI